MMSTHAFAFPADPTAGIGDTNFTFKTPGKALLKTPGRTLHKSRSALQENAEYYGNITTTAKKNKGKVGGNTPFHPAIQARKTLQQSAQKQTISVVVSRPLGDKTPAPNRYMNFTNTQPMKTPVPQTIKMAKLALLPEELMMPTPGALLRPSSARKSLRGARNSDVESIRKKMLQFQTPATSGRHWEVLDEADLELDADEAEAEVAGEEVDDYDDIEYMPPKVPEQPYEPPFEMPDYKTMGRRLLSLVWTLPVDESLDIKNARPIEEEINIDELLDSTVALGIERPELPEFGEGDPFDHFDPPESDKGKVTPATRSAGSSRPTSTAATGRPTSITRSATTSRLRSTVTPAPRTSIAKPLSVTRTTTNTPTLGTSSMTTSRERDAATIRRPATSAAVRPSVSKVVPTKPAASRPPTASTAQRLPTTSGPSGRMDTATTLPRSQSVAGIRPAPTHSKTILADATTAKGRLPTKATPAPAPLLRSRSTTASSASRTPVTTGRDQVKAGPSSGLHRFGLSLVVTADVLLESEDFAFEV